LRPVDSPEEAAFRAEAVKWLEANAARPSNPPIAPSAIVAEWSEEDEERKLAEARAWQRRKYDAGWAGVAWPRAYGGRGGTEIEQLIFDDEESHFDVPRDALAVGLGWCGPALLLLGDEDQKQRFVPSLLSGEEVWCQLFSEPGAGSDLAGLATRASRDGEEWMLEGEKVWTTFAHHSDLGLCIARTDPAADPHRGLSAFIIDMKDPAVEVRRIRQMTGAANFSQVFLDRVRVPDSNRVGDVGDGWRVVITTFMFERTAASFAGGPMVEALRRLLTGGPHRLDRRRRDEWVRIWITDRILSYAAMRRLTALGRGNSPGPEGSLNKLVGTTMLSELYEQAVDLLGAEGMLAGADSPQDGEWQAAFLGTPGLRVGGGTDPIQRNIIAERLLGLPRDLRSD
jgi:alkylation response protein AidB-like acyl-CoA dehydrogenase